LRQESDARMGKVNPWRTVFGGFFRESFPADLSRAPTLADWRPSLKSVLLYDFWADLLPYTGILARLCILALNAFQCVSMAEGLFRVQFAIKSI